MPPATSPLDLPARLGRYTLGPVLGVGGFAVVVRARDESLEADVAIKLLSRRHALDPEIRERFVREARLLRRVRNPAVVTVHDVGESADGRPFLVMDLAEGGVLQDRLGSVPLPPDRATLHAVVTTLAEGLGALHAAGVIHRDVKPANLLLLADGAAALARGGEGGHGTGAGIAAGRAPAPAPAEAQRRLLGPGERLVIGDLGLAKDQLATAYGPTMLGGTPGYQAPEQVEVGAPVGPRTDVYAATAVLWALLTGRPPPGPDQLPVRLLELPPAWRPLLARGLAQDPADRFGSMAEWARAVVAGAGLEAVPPPGAPPSTSATGTATGTGTGSTATVAAAPTAATFPYKGLAAFQPEDAALFFGRGELVDQLVARLQRRPTLVVGGPSGSGKSSLVRAGLLPALAGGALPGSGRWPVCLLTPGAHPLAALHAQLVLATPGGTEPPTPEAVAADPALARRALAGAGPVVVAVDQLEELFTLCADGDEREAFLAVLAALASGDRPAARLVLAVRADFYGACAGHPWLAAAINDNHVLVGPMSRRQLRQAIEGPARRVGLHAEEGLVDRVLADAGGDAGALPLVAHALVETWLRREGDRLTVAGYEAAGGVAGAISRTADQVWDGLDAAQQSAARRLLLRLVHPGDGTPDTKRLVPWAELGDDGTTRLVLSRFADSRLLSVDDSGVQLAHEALLRSWDRLAAWVEEGRDELRARERIEAAAREWERQGRHPDLLYRGLPLATAVEWRRRQGGAVGEPTASFLDTAEAASAAERDAAEASGRRARRLRRRAVTSLAALTVVALVTSAVAVGALGRSRREASTARRASRLASEQLARGLAASALDLRAANPYLATVLAAEAVARVSPPLPEARQALVLSRMALAGDRLVPFGDPVPVGDALAVAVRPAGDLAATGNRDGSLALWDLAARRQAGRLAGPTGGIQGLAFTADGRWLVAASSDRRLWRWEVGGATPGPATVLAEPGSIVWSVAAAPVGTTVAATTEAGQVLLLDAASGEPLGDPLQPGGGELLSAAFSADGATLLAGSGQGQVFAWALGSRQLRFPPLAAHTSDIWELVVRRSPASFVTVSSDGTAKVWDLATGAPLGGGPFDAGTDTSGGGVPKGVRGAALSPDEQTLTLGGADGALYAWSLAGRRLLERQGPSHRDRVTGAARSADGRRLVTLSDDRTLQVWSRQPRAGPVVPLVRLPAPLASMALAPGGAALALGGDDGVVHVVDPGTGAERARLGGHEGAVTALAYAGPGRLLTGDGAGTLRLFDAVRGGPPVAQVRRAHEGAVSALAVGDGGRAAVSGGADGRVRRWRTAPLASSGPALGPLPAPVTDVAGTEDGALLAASTSRGDVFRWTGAGRPVGGRLAVTDDTVWAVALSADGAAMATAGADEVLSLWSPAGVSRPGRRHDLGSHRGGALDTTFVDPATVAAATGEGRVQLWDAGAGEPLGPALPVSAAPVRHLAAGPDGSLWAAAGDGTVSRIDALSLPAACAAAGPSFDDRQRARLLGGRAPLACPPGGRR